MSELILNAILRLFVLVARTGSLTQNEKSCVEKFLLDHISEAKVKLYLYRFDVFMDDLPYNQDEKLVQQICAPINAGLTRRQKNVLLLQFLNIVLADGIITDKEKSLCQHISNSLLLNPRNLEIIQKYLFCTKEWDPNRDYFLLIAEMPGRPKNRFLKRTGLKGFILVLYLPDSDVYFFKHHCQTEIYLNGLPQPPGRVNVLTTGSSIRWHQGTPVYFGDIKRSLNQLVPGKRITFEADRIHYEFSSGHIGLQDISLAEESGVLVALMGASGSGKSTLLHVLNGSEKPTSGAVKINRTDICENPEAVKGLIGYVPQDDLLIEDLTVWENLYFTAKLCFANLAEFALVKLVRQTLDDLGLTEVMNLKVGNPLNKTISGGQRKRLNLGLELVREPSVLFVDEPTSGLSSSDSENIIDLLKELTLNGKLVITVIHQPSSDIFKLFDKLLILDVGGYQIFYGHPLEALPYFSKNGKFLFSEASECVACGNVNPEQIFKIIETKVINESGNFTSERKYSPQQWNAIYLQQPAPRYPLSAEEPPASVLRLPSWRKQVGIFSLRDVLAKLKNRQYLVINCVEAPLLAFILSFIVYYFNGDTGKYLFAKNPNIPAYLFMSVLVSLFMGLTVSAEEIFKDRKILKREKFLNLSHSAYLTSKAGVLFMISAVQCALFVAFGNYYLEIRGMYFAYWGMLFTTACFANLLGLNISSAFNSAVSIYILIPLLLIPQIILSGMVVRFDALNPRIGNSTAVPVIGNFIASRWAVEGLMVSQFRDNKFEKKFYPFDKAIGNAEYKNQYLIPELESDLNYVNLHARDSTAIDAVTGNLQTLQNEITRELTEANALDRIKDISFKREDFYAYREKLEKILNTLKKFYSQQTNVMSAQKEAVIRRKISSEEAAADFYDFRMKHHNEAVADWVKNINDPVRIVKKDNQYFQKLYPIFKTNSNEYFNIHTQLFVPQKRILFWNIDTYWFNILVIWLMTIGLDFKYENKKHFFIYTIVHADGLRGAGATGLRRMRRDFKSHDCCQWRTAD